MNGLVRASNIQHRVKSDKCLELDNHYPRYHADKARRIKERASKCCHTAPEAMDGAIELLEELYVPSVSTENLSSQPKTKAYI